MPNNINSSKKRNAAPKKSNKPANKVNNSKSKSPSGGNAKARPRASQGNTKQECGYQLISSKQSRILNHTEPTSAYATFSKMGSMNPSASSNELTVKYTKFYDLSCGSGFPFVQFGYDLNENGPFRPAPNGSDDNLSVLQHAKIWALPRFNNANVSQATVGILFGVPVRLSEPHTGTEYSTACMMQKATILTPTAVSDWVPVGHFNASKLNNTEYRPYVNTKGVLVFGTIAPINPETGAALTSQEGVEIQLMIEMTVSHTVPNYSQYYGTITVSNSSNSFHLSDNENSQLESLVAMVQPLKLSGANSY